jgi:ribosome assembly protein 3
MSDSEVTAAFTKYYMQRATTEFADDLDRIRGADDFDDEAVQMLVAALRQGTGGFGMDEMRRVVQAARKG